MAANEERQKQININSGKLRRRMDAQGLARLEYTPEEQAAFDLAAQEKSKWKKALGRDLKEEELDAIEQSAGVLPARIRISDLTDAIEAQNKAKPTKVQ